MKKIYRFLFAGVLALCATGCSSSLLDIENPNEVTNTTFWKCKHSASCVFFSPLFLPTFVASL